MKILVPVDFSQTSLEALGWAVSLARRTHAEVTLLTVTEWPGREGGGQGPFQSYFDADEASRALVEGRLRDLVATSPWLAQHPPKVLARFGDPSDEILMAADQEEPDMIVMGTHGRRGVARMLLGSVAEAVVRQAPCPVTVIRAGTGPGRLALAGSAVESGATRTEHERHWWSGD